MINNQLEIQKLQKRIADAKHYIANGINVDYWKKELENIVKELEKLMVENNVK
jgi:hypothetical protein